MANIAVHVGPGDQIEIRVDHQHLSRITHSEAKSIIANLLCFGGKQLRDEIAAWLTGGKIESIAEVIAPEKGPTA